MATNQIEDLISILQISESKPRQPSNFTEKINIALHVYLLIYKLQGFWHKCHFADIYTEEVL